MLDPQLALHLLLGTLFWLGLAVLLQPLGRGSAKRSEIAPIPQGSKKHKFPPLPGLLEKPHCLACAQEASVQLVSLPEPPPKMCSPRGRPRHIHTQAHYCPHPDCPYYGWLDRGNIRANGHPSGRAWRQMHCLACGQYFLETHGTLFYGKQHAPETILQAIGCLAEGLGLRATARVFEIEAKTLLIWLVDAAEHSAAVSTYLLQNLQVSQIQLDELFALVAEWREHVPDEDEAAEALERLPRRPRWVWTAIDPLSKLFIHWSVGERSLAMAQAFVHQLIERLAQGSIPLFLSDGLSHYKTALLTHFGHWWQPPRRSTKGAAPKPRWCPLPTLNYAQVVKKCRRRRLVQLIQRTVFGAHERITQTLERLGWQINTAFVERLNLTLRQHIAALGRRTSHLAKSQLGLERSLALFQSYYNFCLPHASLILNRQPRTPAMAAGITNEVWSLRQLLLFRCPPGPQLLLE